MKIYFTKLGKGILYVLFINVLYNLLMDFLITAVNVIIPVSLSLLRSFCYLALPVFFVSLFTYLRRQNNSEMRRHYQTVLGNTPFSLVPELLRVLRGREFLAESAAFVTLLLPITILSIFSDSLANSLLSALIYTVFFALIDAGIWLLLHHKWAKERLHHSSPDERK